MYKINTKSVKIMSFAMKINSIQEMCFLKLRFFCTCSLCRDLGYDSSRSTQLVGCVDRYDVVCSWQHSCNIQWTCSHLWVCFHFYHNADFLKYVGHARPDGRTSWGLTKCVCKEVSRSGNVYSRSSTLNFFLQKVRPYSIGINA